MKILLLIVGSGIVVGSIIWLGVSQFAVKDNGQRDAEREYAMLIINGTSVQAELAKTPQQRTQGLSDRGHLPENEGMLFVFDSPGQYTFWMKDMHFPLDIIWIDEEGTVADITLHATPESFPQSFSAHRPILYALEVNGGFAEEHSITIGDRVEGLP